MRYASSKPNIPYASSAKAYLLQRDAQEVHFILKEKKRMEILVARVIQAPPSSFIHAKSRIFYFTCKSINYYTLIRIYHCNIFFKKKFRRL